MSNFAKLGLKNNGTMGGVSGGTVNVINAFPVVSTSSTDAASVNSVRLVQNVANTANTTATTANTTATTANTLANAANTTATSANATATAADTLATTAFNNASTALNNAAAANTLATTANTTANAALPAIGLTTAINFGTATAAGTSTNYGNTFRQQIFSALQLLFIGLNESISSTIPVAIGNARVIGIPQVAVFALTSETGPVTVSTTPVTHFRIPFYWRLLGCRANLYTASTSGGITIDIRSVASGVTIPTSITGGSSIFDTQLTIDVNKVSSITSTTSALTSINTASIGLSDDTGLAIFVRNSGTGATGLKLILYYSVG